MADDHLTLADDHLISSNKASTTGFSSVREHLINIDNEDDVFLDAEGPADIVEEGSNSSTHKITMSHSSEAIRFDSNPVGVAFTSGLLINIQPQTQLFISSDTKNSVADRALATMLV